MSRFTHPEKAPKWLHQWPARQKIEELYPTPMRYMYLRMRQKMKIRQINWTDESLKMFIDGHFPEWSLKHGVWQRKCTCRYKNDRCIHTLSAGIVMSLIVTEAKWAAQKAPKKAPKAVVSDKDFGELFQQPKMNFGDQRHQGSVMPVQRQRVTAQRTPQPSVPQELHVEVDYKTAPGYALIRFYIFKKDQRTLSDLNKVYHLAHQVVSSWLAADVWNEKDLEFFNWLKVKLPREQIIRHKLTAYKITRVEFDNWLERWESRQPGRFIDRDTQMPISSGKHTCHIHFELENQGERTKISAIVTTAKGNKLSFHKLATQLKSQQARKVKTADPNVEEFLIDNVISLIEYPLKKATIWELFSKKDPSMGTEHICTHLPTLLENRLDLVKGPAVIRDTRKGKADIRIDYKEGHYIIFPQLNGLKAQGSLRTGYSWTNASAIRQKKDKFVITTFESPAMGKFKAFIKELPAAQEHQGEFYLKALLENVKSLIEAFDKRKEATNPSLRFKMADETKAILFPTILSPVVSGKTEGSWVEVNMVWEGRKGTVAPEALSNAIRCNEELVRDNKGNWMRINMGKVTPLQGYLKENGLFFGSQRFVRSQAAEVLDKSSKRSHVKLTEITRKTMQELSESAYNSEFDLVPHLEPILRPYQKDGFQFLKAMSSFGVGCILADDMGLGKTVQMLAFIASRRQAMRKNLKPGERLHPSIVCAPASVLAVWIQECHKFTPELDAEIYHGTQSYREKLYHKMPFIDLIVTTYGTLRNDIRQLKKRQFDCFILDEAQYIRNPETLTSIAVRQLPALQRIAITGTPIENRVTDLWSIVDFLNPNFLGPLDKFKAVYEMSNSNRDASLRQKLSSQITPLLLRRTKDLVAPELPPRTVESLIIEMHPEQEKIYNQQLDAAKTAIAGESKTNSIQVLALLTKLRQACCHPELLPSNETEGLPSAKLDRMMEMLETLIAEGHSALIFSSFTSMLDLISVRLKEAQIRQFEITGKTPMGKRQEIVKDFNDTEDPAAFLLSLKAAGTGLTLTKADYVFIFDPWWNPAAENQAIDRTHRIGQDKPVIAYKMVAKGTIEEQILKMQQEKQTLFDDVIADGDGSAKSITAEVIASLIN